MSGFDAVIFDLDGTLVDTERLWMQAIDALAMELGRAADPAVYALVVGISTVATAEVFRRHYGVTLAVEEAICRAAWRQVRRGCWRGRRRS